MFVEVCASGPCRFVRRGLREKAEKWSVMMKMGKGYPLTQKRVLERVFHRVGVVVHISSTRVACNWWITG